jgi:hypothetical protein
VTLGTSGAAGHCNDQTAPVAFGLNDSSVLWKTWFCLCRHYISDQIAVRQ